MEEENLNFESEENIRNQKFENIKTSDYSATVVTVTLLEFGDVAVKGCWNMGCSSISTCLYSCCASLVDKVRAVDVPDPQFEVLCPRIEKDRFRSFKTRHIKDNVTSGKINEEFKFVIPRDHDPTQRFPIVFKLVDQDYIIDDEIGFADFDASTLNLNGEPHTKTFNFEGQNGTGFLKVTLKKQTKDSPDFRFSFGLCADEIVFRKKRIPVVCKAMRKILKDEQAPNNELETPIVSLIGSGGGYRAVIGMSGAMEALNDAGLLDIFTYNCGLSGSAWYLSAAYALKGVSSDQQKKFHDELRERLVDSLFWKILNVSTHFDYAKLVGDYLDKHDLPKSIVNFFPGFLVGKHIFGEEKLSTKLSDLASYVENGEVPYPLLIALHVKDNVSANKFHAYVERSPHEIYLPSYGIGLKPEDEGSIWNNGIKLRTTSPEYPLHFTVGMTGCAFSILLNQYFKNGTEGGKVVLNYNSYDKIRIQDRKEKKAMKNSDEQNKEFGIESDSDSDDSECDSDFGNEFSDDELGELSAESPEERTPGVVAASIRSASIVATSPIAASQSNKLPAIAKFLKSLATPVYNNRAAIIGRTAKLPNFVYNCDGLKRYHLNPFYKEESLDGITAEKQNLINAMGHQCHHQDTCISNKIQNLSFADAGIFKNVPTDAVLRPQRGTDILIVMDFNNYKSDDKFHYRPLLAAAAHSWQCGLKFPKIDVEKIEKGEPKELHVFPSDEDDCPTVLWFTLSNKNFKSLENYKQKSKEKGKGKFNDFPVFGQNTNYSTFNFQYDKYHFDQLRELMYHNVFSHVEEIKHALIEATKRKKMRVKSN